MWFNFFMTFCQCGCGAPVQRSFLPGHDAKLKSALVTQAKTTNKWWVREAAVKALVERCWGHFVPAEVLAKVPVRNRYRGKFVASTHVWAVEVFWTDEAECTHSHATCPATKGATSPSGRDGWLCGTCTHVSDLQEQVGRTRFRSVMATAE